MSKLRLLSVGFLSFAAAATAFGAPVSSDVTLQTINGTTNYGVVGTVRAYAYDSHTCNIGPVNLTWANGGTPAYAMNLFRIYDGRLQQIGLGFCKMACCAAAGAGCGTCNGVGGGQLGSGCKDVYSSGYNGGQSRLASRSSINGYTGAVGAYSGATGSAVFKRMQVEQSALVTSAGGFPGARYFAEGVYTATDEVDGSAAQLNNATYRPVTINQTTFNMDVQGTAETGVAAIYAWRNHGLGLGVVDPTVNIQIVDVPDEGRFYVGQKVTPLAGGRYRYDYAIYNLNSHRSGGSFVVPVPNGVTVTGQGFSDVNYHSGEVYDNTDWIMNTGTGNVTWSSPQTFAQNANSNALRWGTMYNYWFEADSAPISRTAGMGLFRPGFPANLYFNIQAPSCRADFNLDSNADFFDYLDFVQAFSENQASSDFNHDGTINFFDYLDYVEAFNVSCD